MADGAGIPLAVYAKSASPHEVRLVGKTLEQSLIIEKPEKLAGDKAYDSDPLDAELAALGIELIAPHKRNRKKPKTQDGHGCGTRRISDSSDHRLIKLKSISFNRALRSGAFLR